MDEEIERRSIAAQVAQKIEESIMAGRWEGRLPGKRTLAAQFGVNVKTCAEALVLLEHRRKIGGGHAGRGRVILPLEEVRRAGGGGGRRLLILHPSDGPAGSEDLRLLREFDAIWKRANGVKGAVAWAAVNFARYRRTRTVLEELVRRHSADALLLHAPTEDWSRQAAALLPFYQVGGPYYDGVPLSLGSYSIDDEVREIVRYLRGLGHQRILIPNESLSERIKGAVIKGLKEGNNEACAKGRWEDYCPDFTEAVPEFWTECWKKAFSSLQPTAVVLFEARHLQSLYGYCHVNGIRIPRDLSIVCMSYEPLFEWSRPKPTMLRYPLKPAAAHFLQWIKGGLKPMGRKFFPLQRIDGESIARVGKGG